jgi:hypothetical protein
VSSTGLERSMPLEVTTVAVAGTSTRAATSSISSREPRLPDDSPLQVVQNGPRSSAIPEHLANLGEMHLFRTDHPASVLLE